MAKYEVTVWTDYTFDVEAESPEEAINIARDMAEKHHGAFYDWQIDEEDIEKKEEQEEENDKPSW